MFRFCHERALQIAWLIMKTFPSSLVWDIFTGAQPFEINRTLTKSDPRKMPKRWQIELHKIHKLTHLSESNMPFGLLQSEIVSDRKCNLRREMRLIRHSTPDPNVWLLADRNCHKPQQTFLPKNSSLSWPNEILPYAFFEPIVAWFPLKN